ISGHGRHVNFPDNSEKYLNKNVFSAEYIFTKAPKEATNICRNNYSVYDIIVAVGGDGTINEVSQGLVNTDTIMGIIPAGSGNGLARYLKIPLTLSRAIGVLNNKKITSIDRVQINDQSFVNMAGIGFDALISFKFAEFDQRGIMPYFYLSLKEFSSYKPKTYNLLIDGIKYTRKAFSISFANSTQFGSNVHIAPLASINDGLIDVCVVKPFPITELANIGLRLFNKTIDKSKYVEIIKAKNIIIQTEGINHVHIDGEPVEMKDKIELKILPKSLNIIYNS
ncbi:diacylglycerol/lipid kinase family protein, partial [Bacteroidota bacterium]